MQAMQVRDLDRPCPAAALATKSPVGQERPGHRHHVGISRCPTPHPPSSGVLIRLEVISGTDTSPLSFFGSPRCNARAAAPMWAMVGMLGLVPADTGVDDSGPGALDGSGQLHDLGPA